MERGGVEGLVHSETPARQRRNAPLRRRLPPATAKGLPCGSNSTEHIDRPLACPQPVPEYRVRRKAHRSGAAYALMHARCNQATMLHSVRSSRLESDALQACVRVSARVGAYSSRFPLRRNNIDDDVRCLRALHTPPWRPVQREGCAWDHSANSAALCGGRIRRGWGK